MAQTKQLLTDAIAVGPGVSHSFHPEDSNRGVVVSIGSAGVAVTATVAVEVSCDNGVTWATRITFSTSLSGTPASFLAPITDTDVDANGPFPLVRGNVKALTGSGARVSLSMTAARSGMGVS